MRSGELVAAEESSVIAKSLLDAIVVEDGKGDRRFTNATCADESDRTESLYQTDDLLDQLTTSKTGLGWWGRQFSERDAMKYQLANPNDARSADLGRVWDIINVRSDSRLIELVPTD